MGGIDQAGAPQVHHLSFAGLVLDVRLAATPAAVWPFLTDPDRINRWSTAPVHGLEPGDGGGYGTVGALRQVVLPRPLPKVTETIQHADVPSRFVYRVVGSRAVRHHRGELLLFPDRAGTRLRWEVEMAFPVPGTTAAARRLVEPELVASMGRLASLVEGLPENAVPAAAFRDDDDPAALSTALATAAAQRILAEEMGDRGDARFWFSRVYQYVTEAMIESCGRGQVAHPTWALRLIPRFHELYHRSLDGPPEPHWQKAFDAIDAAAGTSPSGPLPFWRALVSGARAHIEGDLPRVLASTYTAHYAGRCDYERFRADFLLLASPLQHAWERLSAEVPAHWFPRYLRVLDRLLPPEAVEHLTAQRFYDPLAARRDAFDRGRTLIRQTPTDAEGEPA